MVTQRLANQFGLAAVLVMFALLILVGFQVLPAEWDIPLFILAVALFLVRIILRIVAARAQRGEGPPGASAVP